MKIEVRGIREGDNMGLNNVIIIKKSWESVQIVSDDNWIKVKEICPVSNDFSFPLILDISELNNITIVNDMNN